MTVSPAETTVCFIGDSFVAGIGDPDGLGWAGRVARALHTPAHHVTAYALGVRRQTSVDIAKRWKREASVRFRGRQRPVLIFSFGVNDSMKRGAGQRVAVERSRDQARLILQAAKQMAPTLFVGPPPVVDADHTARTAYLSAEYRDLCEMLDVPFLETCAVLRTDPIWMADQADGAHPAAEGYNALARLVLNWPPLQDAFRV